MKREHQQGKKAQSGMSLISVLIAVVISAALGVAAIRGAMGQKRNGEFNAGIKMVTADIPTALTSYFYTSGHSYQGLSISSASLFNTRYGIPTAMPWNDAWKIQSQSPAAPATPTTLTFRFTCSSLGSTCAEFLTAVNAGMSASSLITTVAAVGSTDVDVTYKTPR